MGGKSDGKHDDEKRISQLRKNAQILVDFSGVVRTQINHHKFPEAVDALNEVYRAYQILARNIAIFAQKSPVSAAPRSRARGTFIVGLIIGLLIGLILPSLLR